MTHSPTPRSGTQPRSRTGLHPGLQRERNPPITTHPGLPLLVAAIYKLSGGVHERLARLLLALIGSLSVLFAYLIGRRLASPLAG